MGCISTGLTVCDLLGCGGFTGYFPSNAKNCTALVSQLKRHKSFSHDRPYAQLSISPDLKFCININSSQALYRLLPSPPMQPTLFPPHKHRFFFLWRWGDMRWGPFRTVCIIWNKSRLQKSDF